MSTKSIKNRTVYAPALSKSLKGSKNIHVSLDEATGTVYVSNGYYLVKLRVDEYDALVRPITQRPAGNFVIIDGEETERKPMNAADIFSRALSSTLHPIRRAPLVHPIKVGKKDAQLVLYYSPDADFVAAFNAEYVGIVSDGLPCKSAGPLSGLIVYLDEEPIVYVLPVKVEDKPDLIRATRAYFNAPGTEAVEAHNMSERFASLRRISELEIRLASAESCYAAAMDEVARARDRAALAEQGTPAGSSADNSAELDELRQTITAKNEQIEQLVNRLNAQQAQLERKDRKIERMHAEKAALIEAQQAAPVPAPEESAAQAAPVPADKAAALEAQLAKLEGVTVTIKGAQSVTPVFWLSGDVDAHAAEIRELGGQWSGKRGAYYVKP